MKLNFLAPQFCNELGEDGIVEKVFRKIHLCNWILDIGMAFLLCGDVNGDQNVRTRRKLCCKNSNGILISSFCGVDHAGIFRVSR